jgi:hypothetical protein
MNFPHHRWKATTAGLVVPEYFDVVVRTDAGMRRLMLNGKASLTASFCRGKRIDLGQFS